MQVQGVIGHKSEKMTEMYHPMPNQIADVMKAQAAITGAQKSEKEKPPKVNGKEETSRHSLKIVKMP